MKGLSVLEYFISTHGARKGLADTALRTSDAATSPDAWLTSSRMSSSARRTAARPRASGTRSPRSGFLPSYPSASWDVWPPPRVVDPDDGEIIVDRNEEIR